MAGFKYYAGSHEIAQFADDTSACNGGVGVALPKNSYLYYDNGFLDPSESHNPVVIRRNTLGFGIISAQGLTTNTTNTASVTAGNCCDQIQIVYEDFNQSHHREGEQPYKKYRITYYALPNDTGGYAAWKRVEHYFQPRVGCSFFTGATPPPQDDGNDGGGGNNSEIFNLDNQFGVGNFGGGIASSGVSDDADDVNLVVRGTWATNCNACTPGTMVRDNIDDMEFIPFDENGKIIQTDAGVFPAPEHIGIRDRLLDIRGVDIRLTFASKDDFFQKAATTDNPRVVLGLAGGNRNNTIADGRDRKLRDSVIVTVHTRNIGETF